MLQNIPLRGIMCFYARGVVPHSYYQFLQTLPLSKPSSATPSGVNWYCLKPSLILHIFPSRALLRISASSILATHFSTISSRRLSFLMRTHRKQPFNPTACIPSVLRLSMRLFLRSVLFHALSRLQSWISQPRIRRRRLLSSLAQGRSLYPNSFDMRLFPPLPSPSMLRVLALQLYSRLYMPHLVTDSSTHGEHWQHLRRKRYSAT